MSPPQPPIPRGRYLGHRVGGDPADEREHFFQCTICGGWVDMRDMGDVLAHEGPHERPPQS